MEWMWNPRVLALSGVAFNPDSVVAFVEHETFNSEAKIPIVRLILSLLFPLLSCDRFLSKIILVKGEVHFS